MVPYRFRWFRCRSKSKSFGISITYAWASDTLSVSDISTAPIVGVGKERRTLGYLTIQTMILLSMILGSIPVTQATLTVEDYWSCTSGFSSVNTIDAQSLRYFLYQTCPLHSKSGCGKREAHIDWSMVIPVRAASVSGTTSNTTGPVPGDSRQ